MTDEVPMTSKPKKLPPLSARLRTAADLIGPGNTVADIGCDHGYISVYLRLTGRSPRCICTDIREGPLVSAAENIRKFGADGIELRRGDGLACIAPKEAESLVITGMGGELICRILSAGEDTAKAAKELILGPQSEPEKVRRQISESGFFIADEAFVLEDGKYYPVIKALRGVFRAAVLFEEELRYGPVLLKRRDPVLKQYLEKENTQLLKVLSALLSLGRDHERTFARAREVEHLLSVNEAARNLFNRTGE